MKKHSISKKTTIMNMILAVLFGTTVGLALGYFNIPKFLLSGIVAVVSVLTEHYLTVNPLIFETKQRK